MYFRFMPIVQIGLMGLFVVSTNSLAAETAYVSDELEVTMRTGPGVKNKINRMLKSGQALEILQDNANGWSEVRTSNGKMGWVLKRFLMDEPSARSRLDEVKTREQALAQQQQEIESLRAEAQQREQKLASAQEMNSSLKAELKNVKGIASDTLAIDNKNTELSAALEAAESNQTSLQLENQRLKSNSEQAWFVRGAGVILLGMFLGLLIPKLRFKKKRKWGDFTSY